MNLHCFSTITTSWGFIDIMDCSFIVVKDFSNLIMEYCYYFIAVTYCFMNYSWVEIKKFPLKVILNKRLLFFDCCKAFKA